MALKAPFGAANVRKRLPAGASYFLPATGL
jgi:hypothetical protein